MRLDHAPASAFPLWVSWEVTEACNYHCIHCRVNATPAVGELTHAECKRVIDELVEAGVYQVNFSGGEPFIRRDFLSLLHYASQQGLLVGITSNGSCITPEITADLAAVANLMFLQISLDGAASRTHEHIRGVKGSFERAVTTLRMASDAGIPTGVVMTVMRPNLQEFEDLADLASNLGAGTFGARRFIPIGRGMELQEQLELSADEYRGHLQRWSERVRSDTGPMKYVIEEPLLAICGVGSSVKGIGMGCPAGQSYGAITAAGDVRPCIFLPISLGNLRGLSFQDIWTSSPIGQEIRERNLTGRCGSCGLRVQCGGCRAMAYLRFGDYHADDPTCFYPTATTDASY